jgi:hypothetical protein
MLFTLGGIRVKGVLTKKKKKYKIKYQKIKT